jgi:hypothetical protein
MKIAMSLADELFGPETAERPPPEAQRWEFFLAQGVQPVCAFVRRREGLGWTPARIVMSYPGAKPPVAPDPPIAWDARLERWLLDHKVKAVDHENEAERFGFGLEVQLEPIERRPGSGYFNAVLVQYLRESGFAEQRVVQDKLAAIHTYSPNGNDAMVDCMAQIRAVLGANARTLESLGYPRDTAISILANAIAYYLDERFNIHTRALLGVG